MLVGCTGETEDPADVTGQPRSASPSSGPQVPENPQAAAANADPEPAERPMKVGDHVRPWHVAEWANSEPLPLRDLRGQVVLVRFWTDSCPYCARSVPAVQKLADEFRDRPVTFVGLYHSKPRGSERPWETAVDQARRWGVMFPLAYDRNWKTVRSWWLDGNRAAATSASFVIDGDGRIVHIHPGPTFYPSGAPADAEYDRDFHAIRNAIRKALSGKEPDR